MTWPFCPQCGTILDPPSVQNVRCSFCKFECLYVELGVEEVVTRSAPTPKPTWIEDDDEKIDDPSNIERNAIISEICPKCGNPEMYFYTMQLRSADEGSTVFYECPACNHKFNLNN